MITSAINSHVAAAAKADAQQVNAIDIERLGASQQGWASVPIKQRLRVIRAFRSRVAANPLSLLSERHERKVEETLLSEVLPLVDACRFLERNTERTLRSRRVGGGGSALMRGLRVETRREPIGIVLIICASNYPLFLPGVQLLQALAAGNAVLLKPSRGGTDAARSLQTELRAAGLPQELLRVLPEDPRAATDAIAAGVDKVFLTGSAETGRAVLRQCAATTIPAVVELSGCDAVFVQRGADLDRVVRCVIFGLTLNGGATCIAPRRMFVPREMVPEVESRLRAALCGHPPVAVDARAAESAKALIADALAEGAALLTGEWTAESQAKPFVLAEAKPSMDLLRADVFAPVLSIVAVNDDEDALRADGQCPYALGASVFGPLEAAQQLASRVNAGCVVVNDLVAPTADPRVSFGGRGASGFGVTRGHGGLLEMTSLKTIVVQRSKWIPHLQAPPSAEMACDIIRVLHSRGLGDLSRAIASLARDGYQQWRQSRSSR